jgi:hypothetical protein
MNDSIQNIVKEFGKIIKATTLHDDLTSNIEKKRNRAFNYLTRTFVSIDPKIQFQVGYGKLDGRTTLLDSSKYSNNSNDVNNNLNNSLKNDNLPNDLVEIILTSQLNKKSFDCIDLLQKEISTILFSDDNTKFVISKYIQQCNSSTLKSMTVDVFRSISKTDETKNEKEITIKYDDFTYEAIINTTDSIPKLNLILYVNKDKIDFVTSLTNDTYIPCNSAIHTFLVMTLGEYDLMVHIDQIKICPDQKKKNAQPLLELRSDIAIILDTIYVGKNVLTCSTCRITNKNRLLHKSGKNYFCSAFCNDYYHNNPQIDDMHRLRETIASVKKKLKLQTEVEKS